MKKMYLILPVLAGIMFGSAGIFVRTLTAEGFDNITVLFTRTAFATLEMAIFIFIYNRRLFRIKIKHLPIFLGTGLLGMMGLNLCYNNALNGLTLSMAAVLLSTAPVFVMLLAAVIFKEHVTSQKIICMFIMIAGCVLASGLLENSSGIDVSISGILFGVGAAFFYAMYNIFSKIATEKNYDTYTVIFFSVLIISIGLIPFADFPEIGMFIMKKPITNILFLLIHSLITSVLPYIFLTVALLHAEAGKVSILSSGGEPIAAVVFGILVYGEIPSILMLAGLAVVILALLLLNVKKQS